MKYRAIAVDLLIDGHPVQAFALSLTKIAEWSELIVARYRCAVDIFITDERLLRRELPKEIKPDEIKPDEIKPNEVVKVVKLDA